MPLRRFALNSAMLVGCSLAASALGQSIPLSATAQASGAAITHDQGIEFVTIGERGNPAWNGVPGPSGAALGRGGVNYDYRIGRFEVTTAQWVEFFNAAFDRPTSDRLPHLVPPGTWGATGVTPTVPGGRRWTVPAGNEKRAVGNISWRMAAMYCNWLCNDKSTDRSAFLSGAYDVSTFGYNGNIFTDQLTHNAGARYWIPTWDEWIKAAHYDPNRNGPGQGGYWAYSTTSDMEPLYGPPINYRGFDLQVNGAWALGRFGSIDPFQIPLGAYPTVQSPWGLLDAAGATAEWTETSRLGTDIRVRVLDGSNWNSPDGVRADDLIGGNFSGFPSESTYEYGFRIASAVPSPSTASPLLLASAACMRRRRSQASAVG